MSKYSLFDGAIILALDKRKEHWQALLKQAEALGIECEAFICGKGQDKKLVYDLIDEPNPDVSRWGYGHDQFKKNHYWAFKSHQGMIQRAKERGYKRVLFLEDDAVFTSRFEVVMDVLEGHGWFKDKVWIPNGWSLGYDNWRDYDFMYLGWWHTEDGSEFNREVERKWENDYKIDIKDITAGMNVGGLHALVIDERMYDLIFSLQPTNPIDTQLCQYRHFIKSALVLPKIIHVKSMYSETEGCHFERVVL